MRPGLPPGFPEAGGDADKWAEVDRRLSALERANSLTRASIGSGGLTIKDAGKLTFLDSNGDPLVTIDQDGAVISGAPVVLDGDGLDIAGGLVVVNGLGLAVGTDVVIDAEGLKIGGLLQPALAVLTGSNAANNVSVGTSAVTLNQVVLSIPPWVDEVSIVSIARLQMSNVSGTQRNFNNILINDVGGVGTTTDDQWTIPNNETISSTVALTSTLSSPGSSVTIRQNASATAGTHATNESRLEVIAILRRTS